MKKILTMIIVATLASSSQAVSFDWGSNGKVSFGDTVMNSTTYQATAYMVLLGTTTESAWTDTLVQSLTDGSVGTSDYVATATTRTSGATANRGRYSAQYSLAGNQGYVYGVFMTYTDGDGKAWYNFSSDIFTVPAAVDNETGVTTTFAHLATTGTISGDFTVANSVGKGWVAVPEPSVGLLALAGIGMLIRRKRA